MKSIQGEIVACMATYPGRFESLQRVVESIARQVDRVLLYVNDSTHGLPDVERLGNVTVLDSSSHAGNLSANGKMYPLRFLRNCLVFTVDDDFIYPQNYVSELGRAVVSFNGRCLTAVHGSVLPPRPTWYYERTEVFGSMSKQSSYKVCNLVGSGTACFSQSGLDLDFGDFEGEVMVDAKLSRAAAAQGIPMFIIPRKAKWLHHVGGEGLWESMRELPLSRHTIYAREFDWGFDAYRSKLAEFLDFVGSRPDWFNLDAELLGALDRGGEPSYWSEGPASMRSRLEFLRLIEDEQACP